MKKPLFLLLLLALAACKKSATKAQPSPPPDITESLSLTITNLNPDQADSLTGHVADSFSWSIPNAYGDTCTRTASGCALPLSASSLILKSVISGYGYSYSFVDMNRLIASSGSGFEGFGMLAAFPADTADPNLGYSMASTSGGDITFADTVAVNRTDASGLSRMLNWWRNDALPINDSVTNFVNINTNPLMLNVLDTLTVTSKKYIGDDLVVSGTFSERIYTALAFTYQGSFCQKTWYIKGSFANLIYVYTPE